MAKIIKLNESDVERLVKRIIKEDDENFDVETSDDTSSNKPMGVADLKKATRDTGKKMGGLSGDDKIAYEGLLQLAEKLKAPGNQITGKFKMRLFQLFKEAGVNV
tara:strand:+ start:22421 stop:22735 length:315 start_codon:yes stop_codon:yes gene_type:complete